MADDVRRLHERMTELETRLYRLQTALIAILLAVAAVMLLMLVLQRPPETIPTKLQAEHRARQHMVMHQPDAAKHCHRSEHTSHRA